MSDFKVGDIIKVKNMKGFWKILSDYRYDDTSISHWKLVMFLTDDFQNPKKAVPGRLYNESYATIITIEWCQKQIEDAHKNYDYLWAKVEDDKYVNRDK